MTSIGAKTPVGNLFLPAVGDWSFSYQVQPGSDPLDAGWRLYLVVGVGGPEWVFVISSDGMSATVEVGEADIAGVAQLCPFWFLLDVGGRSVELLTGQVMKS